MAASNRQQEGIVSDSSIRDCCVNRFGDATGQETYDLFVPQDDIDSLTERDRVELTLKDQLQLNMAQDVLELTEYVVKKATKVFLLLIYCDAIDHIQDLQKADFTNNDLPLFEKPYRGGSGVSMHKWRLNDDASTYAEEQILSCFSTWPESKLDDFLRKQWVFLAPAFTKDKFDYVFYPPSPLPYLSTQAPGKSAGGGHFGTIKRCGLHNGHHDHQSLFEGEETEPHVKVAVKKLNERDSPDTDVNRFYVKERDTLEKMRRLDHRHLIKAIAAYKKGFDRYFVFPWAQGGSLRDLWQTNVSLDGDLVSWAIDQMAGLSDGLRQLHKRHTRHGDLKPENILCFTSGNGSPHQGTLVLADVGLAKYHPEYTRDRTKHTTTRHGTKIYEPPEMFTNQGNGPVSRKYDVWSLGCVFLEFTIWLLYGRSGLASFRQKLFQDHRAEGFWETESTQKPKIHQDVEDEINKILTEDLKADSALRDMVKLIVKLLLAPMIVERATTKAFLPELNAIKGNCSNTQYLFNSELQELARRRSESDANVVDEIQHPSRERTSLLRDQWQNVADNETARTLISRLGWPSLHPKTDTSRFCHSCAALDFQLPTLDLHRSIQELGSGPDDCSLCHFLFSCLVKVKPTPDEPVRLFRDDASHTLRVLPSASPIISIYFDPVSRDTPPSYAQLGLPILPERGSQRQFSLLNEWINLCDTNHDCTSVQEHEGSIDSMPTRVLHVGTVENPCLRLVETGDSIRDKYIALSHCWGKLSEDQKFTTSAGNLDDRKQEIPFDEMPKSFQDAVRVTRNLGVSYLWIDSLCIIQGDEADWEVESAKMEEVFNSAYCTIAASSAESSLVGFLGERTPRAYATIQTSQGPVIYLAEAIDNFQGHVEQSVLNSRGWVLQERALSRRTIHFTSTQAYWECGHGIYCETLAQLRNPQSQFLGDSSFPNLGLQYYKDERIRLVQHLYRVYCALQLTNPADRSKAILGLQKRLSRTFKSRADYGVIYGYFERTILWQAKTPNSLSRIPYGDERAVPSWSWMACTGEIQYMDIPFRQVSWTGNPTNPIENVPEGAEWDGELTAEASQLLIGRNELLSRAVIDCRTYTFDSVTWRCVVVGKSKMADEHGNIVHYVLLIRPLGGPAQVYERAGVGKLLDTQISKGTTKVYLR